eukprot:GHVS01064696.1.p1 GENE.GHVS01064696.1~~GHVS01064696.1.p1  ORF type:complete len:140 (-),score=100.51 GHVS01064696.1:64-483(-)
MECGTFEGRREGEEVGQMVISDMAWCQLEQQDNNYTGGGMACSCGSNGGSSGSGSTSTGSGGGGSGSGDGSSSGSGDGSSSGSGDGSSSGSGDGSSSGSGGDDIFLGNGGGGILVSVVVERPGGDNIREEDKKSMGTNY